MRLPPATTRAQGKVETWRCAGQARPERGSRWRLGLCGSGNALVSLRLSSLPRPASGPLHLPLPCGCHTARSSSPPPHSFQGLRECLPVGGPPRPPDPSDLPLLSGACFPSGALLFLLVWTSEFRSSDLFVVCLPDSTVLWRVSGAEWLGGAADGLASVTAVCAGLSVRKGRRLPRGAGISCVNAPGR